MANPDHLATVRAALDRYARGHTLDESPTTDAIAALCEEVERLRAAMSTISSIRDSIIGAQAVNWSEHIYPLVAALDGAGFKGAGYESARANLGTMLQRIATLESALRAILDAPQGPEEHDAMVAARTLLGEG